MKIATIEAIPVEIPFHRPHKLAGGVLTAQRFVIVRMRMDNGLEGLGEASTCWPTWLDENPESVKAVIDRYLAPALVGQDARRIEALTATMDAVAPGNPFAKAALEFALFDAVGKRYQVPVYQLLGGLAQERALLSWSLASGDVDADVREAERLMARGHRCFKIKVGAVDPDFDIRRVCAIAEAIGGRARLRVDANQGWDEVAAMRGAKAFGTAGIEIFEQPVPRWNIDALARLTAAAHVPIMADEGVGTVHEAFIVAARHAANIFALKPAKAGGLAAARKVAAIAEGAGIKCYVGCMIETGIGTSAYMHFTAASRVVTYGCELFGPLLLTDDVVNEPTRFEDGHVYVSHAPGLGVTLDEARLARYRKD